jgi:uncharacterized membrane protein YqjE
MTALKSQSGPRRRLTAFDVVIATCLAALAAVGFFWGIHLSRSSEHRSAGSYFIWSCGFLTFAGYRLFFPRENRGRLNITSSIMLLLYAIDKWLRAESLHVLAVLFLLASGCYAASAIHEMRSKKKSAAGENATVENTQLTKDARP